MFASRLSRSSIFSILLFLSLIVPALAADCWPEPVNKSFILFAEQNIWEVRARLCNGTVCPDISGSTCRLSGPVDGYGNYAAGARMNGLREVPAFPSCWSALEQIIDQCYRTNKVLGGNWTWGAEYYELGIYAKSDLPPTETITFRSPILSPTTTRTPTITMTLPTNTDPTTTATATATAPPNGSNTTALSAGASAGIGIGATVLVFALLGLLFLWRRRRRSKYDAAVTSAAELQAPDNPAELFADPNYYRAELFTQYNGSELQTEANMRDVGMHVTADLPLQPPFQMVRAGVVYTPSELATNEDAARELVGDDINGALRAPLGWAKNPAEMEGSLRMKKSVEIDEIASEYIRGPGDGDETGSPDGRNRRP